jgi:hypothetical protein
MSRLQPLSKFDLLSMAIDGHYTDSYVYPKDIAKLELQEIIRSSAYSAYNFRRESEFGASYRSVRIPRPVLKHISSLTLGKIATTLEWLNHEGIFIETEMDVFKKDRYVLLQTLPDFNRFTLDHINPKNESSINEAFGIIDKLKKDLGVILQLSPTEFFDDQETLASKELIVTKSGVRIVGTGLYRADGNFIEKRIENSNQTFREAVEARLMQYN